ncbi:MAG TPA: ABC transporter permease [Bacteroidales bacterium]|nr:MAG: ABC transporter permease [Bacteroidetes bacterium GWF2_33_38]OFY76243.1 MAG: ABC transporter permease [Bacteroidetes bacterium RIFOXYA12_FULL_33_9]OFY84996.1 MAG: ABC transporter permease [Bacteroidetes bacterium RIFOXYA2_FULL_33_7]HBF87415.1 ABC transporter permease [Bacteroidales bacterium]
MSKITLIIKREYLTRVKKKSFIIMTIIGPILMAALMIVPAWVSQLEDQDNKTIAIIDQTKAVSLAIENTQYLKFERLENKSLDDVKKDFKTSGYYAVLFIPENITSAPSGVQLFSNKQPNLGVKMHISNALEKELESEKLKASGIDENILKAVKTNVNISTFKWTDEGVEEESSTELTMAVGFIAGFMIYLFIFLYGAQVMRGVIEEKTSRIVEVIISSVRPFQLMMGKIVGVAMVGLTQFLLWIILTFVIVTVVQTVFFDINPANIQQEVVAQDLFTGSSSQLSEIQPVMDENASEIQGMLSTLKNIDFAVMIGMFLFYFLGGYLLYSSLFAAIGGAVDNEADTQQFMLPISAPLIVAFIVGQNVVNNPDGAVSFWFSIIPFTSPVVMMIRIPFGVPFWEIALSAVLLVLTFIGTTWLAGKIYRTGILMYGKKITYKELWKWLRYSS